MTDLPRLRTLHGRSAAVWVGDGHHEVAADHWLALSGVAHADYNLALCHGNTAPVATVRDTLVARRRPALLALTPDVDPGPLSEAGWRRVGDAPLMVVSTAGREPDPAVHRLPAGDVGAARALVADVYGLDEEVAGVAVRSGDVPGRTVWGLYEDGRLRSCVLAVRVEDAVVLWSMATGPTDRRRGYARRLLDSALHAAQANGAATCVLHASAIGQPFYLGAGFEVVERWEFWSRPRWVLAAER